MRQRHLAGVAQHCRIDLILRANYDVHIRQHRTRYDAERPRIMPLVRAKIEVEDDRRIHLLGILGAEHGRTAARLLAQIGAGKLKNLGICHRRRQHVVDRKFDVGAVLPVVDQGKAVRRFDAEDDRAGAVTRLARG